MYVCICRAITENDIQKATQRGRCSLGQLAEETGLGTQCGQCLSRTESLIDIWCEKTPISA
jgi:bacterioferritin-associated ferredoxin